MGCRNCIFPRNCANYHEVECKNCEKYENAVPVGTPLLPDYACFKCKYDNTCVVPKTHKTEEAKNDIHK